MTKNTPDERLVYLALKNTFEGADAQVRKPKKIRELIQKRQDNADIRDLIREHNIDNVCNVAKTLLELQIFESTLNGWMCSLGFFWAIISMTW
jgi:lipoate synthase